MLTSTYLDVKPPKKFSLHTHSFNSRKSARCTPRRRQPNRDSGREMWGKGSRTFTKSPPSAHSSSTRGCPFGKGQVAIRPTITGPPGWNLVMTSALAARPAPADAAFFVPFFSPCLCLCLWAWIDREKTPRVQVETQPQTRNTKACSVNVPPCFCAICLRMLSAMQSPPSGLVTKNFWLHQPTDAESLRPSAELWMTRATCFKLAWPPEVEPTACELVGPDPQTQLLIIAPGSNFFFSLN